MNYVFSKLIQNAADAHPDKDAFRCGSRSVTYTELFLQMNQLANLLIDLGVKKGDRVGVCLNRSLETAIAIYGIMNAGAAYVPLDPHAPVSRMRFLIQDCGIKHVVTNPSQKRRINELFEQASPLKSVIGFKGEWAIPSFSWDEVFLQSNSKPAIRLLAHDLAYVMYTSGSTGQPKGIMHSHYSGLSYAKLSADLYDLKHTDRIGNHAPLHFDISTLGYFSSPLVGATTVIVPDAHTKMPVSLGQLMEKEQLTVWYSVPLALIQLLTSGLVEQRDLNSIRWVLFGGEPFPVKHLRGLMELWPQARFSNVYGPAEVNQCTYYHLPKPPETDDPIPLGEVWENTDSLILNTDNQLVEQGEVGELLIRSATRMLGYWNQPELTEKSYYKRTRISGCEEIFYRTGDLVKLNDQNQLLFLGRKDRQVKYRGYRVELDAVEAVLLKHDAIEEAAVFPIRNVQQELTIEAAVILKEGSAVIDEQGLKVYLSNYLPNYAVPTSINIVVSFPRTSTGKISHRQLSEKFSSL